MECLDLQSRGQTLNYGDPCLPEAKTRRRNAKENCLRVVGLLSKSLHPQIPLPASKLSPTYGFCLSLPYTPIPLKARLPKSEARAKKKKKKEDS